MADAFTYEEAFPAQGFSFEEAFPEIEDEKAQKEQEEILSRPAVPAYITERGERPDYSGPQLVKSSVTPWQRFRSSELGHKIFGSTELEKEAFPDLKPGGVGLMELPEKALQFTTAPPPIANPIRQQIDTVLARTDLPPTFKGLVKGGTDLVLNLPLAPIPVFPKTVLTAFAGDYIFHLPEARQAYHDALKRGDYETATRIAVNEVGGGALLAYGAGHSAYKPELKGELKVIPMPEEAKAGETLAPIETPAVKETKGIEGEPALEIKTPQEPTPPPAIPTTEPEFETVEVGRFKNEMDAEKAMPIENGFYRKVGDEYVVYDSRPITPNPIPTPPATPAEPAREVAAEVPVKDRISAIETEIMKRSKPFELLNIQSEATKRGLSDEQYLDLLEKWAMNKGLMPKRIEATTPIEAEATPVSELTHPILGMTETQLSLPSLRTLKARDPAQWANVQKVFGAKSASEIAKLAKQRFDQIRQKPLAVSSEQSGLGAGAATTPAVEPLKVTAPAQPELRPGMSIMEKEKILGDQVRDKILNAPSFPDLMKASKAFNKSLGNDFVEEVVIQRPWILLSKHAGVMNAKSQRAKTLKSLADAVIKEAKLPMEKPGRFRGQDYEIDWDKVAQSKPKGIAASAREKLAEPTGSEEAFINIGPVFQALQNKRNLVAKQLAGESAPKTSNASEQSGNKLVRYASAKIAAPEIAKYMATEVLGPNYKDKAFSVKLGAVLVEDRLRAIKQSFQQANNPAAANVQSIISKPWSPFSTEAEYQAAIADPAIQQAIQRHRVTVQPTAQLFHEEAGGQLAGPGLQTGAFVNLKATALNDILTGASRGNLQNPLRRPSRFSRQAKGSAEQYELDYRTLAERMVSSNYEEYAKRQWYDQMVNDGLAQLNDPGDPIPQIGNKPAVRFTIERKGTPMGLTPTGQARARTYVKYLDVRSDLANEVRQALNTDGKIGGAAIVNAANILNHIQLAGPTDAVWHTANMISSIAGSQGGKNVLIDLVRQLPGVNLADALTRVVANAIRTIRDTPDVQRELAEIAEIGALRSEQEASKFAINRRIIGVVDKAGRLIRNQMYQNLVDRGLITESEAGRREWVNQMGQYNPRLMGQFQRFFKEAGFSPFVVAGRNFNRAAWRRLTLSPGIEVASPAAAIEMRLINGFGLLATLVAIPSLINYFTTGSPAGRPGTKFGQIDTGKDSDGKHIVIDPAQWTGLRRGLRISGAQAIIEGLRRHQPMSEIKRTVIRDELGGIIHPWAGPAPTALTIAKTGYSPMDYKESQNPNDYGENLKAALKHLNPIANAILEGKEKGGITKKVGMSLAGAFGVKEAPTYSAFQDIHAIARDWMEKSEDKKIKHDYEQRQKEHFESDYNVLRDALRHNDLKKANEEYDKLLELEKRPDVIARLMHPGHPLISRQIDSQFLESLNPEQQKIYDKAQEEKEALWERFQTMLDQRP